MSKNCIRPLFAAALLGASVAVVVGGVGTLDHMVEGVKDGHASAVLAASIFHFGTYSIGQAKRRMAACGVPVRDAR